MNAFEVHLSVNVNIKELVKHISKQIGQNLSYNYFKRHELNGGVAYTAYINGMMIAAYNHPTKRHTIYITTENQLSSYSSDAGKWAVSCVNGVPSEFKIYYRLE